MKSNFNIGDEIRNLTEDQLKEAYGPILYEKVKDFIVNNGWCTANGQGHLLEFLEGLSPTEIEWQTADDLKGKRIWRPISLTYIANP